MVRVVFAQCIVPLAETAIQFLEMSQAVKAHGTVKSREAKELNATFEEVGAFCVFWRLSLTPCSMMAVLRSRMTFDCEICSLKSKSKSLSS